jgi:hypothetical protein
MDHSTLFPLFKICLTISSITKARVHILLWLSISPQTLIVHPIHPEGNLHVNPQKDIGQWKSDNGIVLGNALQFAAPAT